MPGYYFAIYDDRPGALSDGSCIVVEADDEATAHAKAFASLRQGESLGELVSISTSSGAARLRQKFSGGSDVYRVNLDGKSVDTNTTGAKS